MQVFVIFDEILKHISEIEEKSGLNRAELNEILDLLLKTANIKIIPSEALINFVEPAGKISPDPDDIQYFALALKLNCPIWSNDKKLKDQDKIKIYSTPELIKIV